jgi:hypothetical protein
MYIVLGLFQSYSLNLVYFLDNDRDGGICKAKLGGWGGWSAILKSGLLFLYIIINVQGPK